MREFSLGAVLRPDLALLTRQPELYGGDDASRSVRLAEALGSGPIWSHLGSRFAVAVRAEPEPLIALLGEPKPEDVPRLRALGWQVRDCLDRLSPVPLSRTVELCEILAERLQQLGIEMTRHRRFSDCTGVPVFSCDARSPWQRGTNENTNGRLRQ